MQLSLKVISLMQKFAVILNEQLISISEEQKKEHQENYLHTVKQLLTMFIHPDANAILVKKYAKKLQDDKLIDELVDSILTCIKDTPDADQIIQEFIEHNYLNYFGSSQDNKVIATNKIEPLYPPEKLIYVGILRKNLKLIQQAVEANPKVVCATYTKDPMYPFEELDSSGVFPLYEACRRGANLEILDYLLIKGADVNQIDTIYHEASLHVTDKPEIIKWLVHHKANINAKARHSRTAIERQVDAWLEDRKAKEENEENIVFFIEQGAELSDHALSRLFLSKCTNNVLSALLTRKDIDLLTWCDKDGDTALHLARFEPEIVKKLLEAGLDPWRTNKSKKTVLDRVNHSLPATKTEMARSEVREILSDAMLVNKPNHFIGMHNGDREHQQLIKTEQQVIRYEGVDNDYQLIYHVMKNEVYPIRYFCKERGNHLIEGSTNTPSYYESHCCTEYQIRIKQHDYELCGNLFWYLLTTNYCPSPQDPMNNYGLERGFFYLTSDQYDSKLSWPIRYEDETLVYKSELFMRLVQLFPESIYSYLLVFDSGHNKEEAFVTKSQQAKKIYIDLLCKEHPDLTEIEVKHQFEVQINAFPEIKFNSWMRPINECAVMFSSVIHLFEEVQQDNKQRYVSNLLKATTGLITNTELIYKEYLSNLNRARKDLNLIEVTMTELKNGLSIVISEKNSKYQLSVAEEAYESLLLPIMQGDLRFNYEKYKEYQNKEYPLYMPQLYTVTLFKQLWAKLCDEAPMSKTTSTPDLIDFRELQCTSMGSQTLSVMAFLKRGLSSSETKQIVDWLKSALGDLVVYENHQHYFRFSGQAIYKINDMLLALVEVPYVPLKKRNDIKPSHHRTFFSETHSQIPANELVAFTIETLQLEVNSGTLSEGLAKLNRLFNLSYKTKQDQLAEPRHELSGNSIK